MLDPFGVDGSLPTRRCHHASAAHRARQPVAEIQELIERLARLPATGVR